MGLVSSISRSLEQRNSVADPDRWTVRWLTGGGSESWSGETVTPEGSLACDALLACVRVLAESAAVCPAKVFEERPNGDIEPAFWHPVHRLLYVSPNPEQTPFMFWEYAVASMVLWGNFYAQKVYNGAGYVAQMWPLRPDHMTVERPNPTGPRVYTYHRLDGTSRTFQEGDILHISGMGFDGLKGYSLVSLMANQLGSALSADKFAAKLWKNGVKASGVLMVPGKIGDVASKNLRTSFESKNAGMDNAHGTIVLEEGVTWKQLTIPPNDAQFLETRKDYRTVICGWTRVPPHMIAQLDRSTNNNIEHQGLEFSKYTMHPWFSRIEQQCALSLFGPIELGRYFIEFDMDVLQRGDAKSMAEATRTLTDCGVMSLNEGRRRHNMNAEPAGDVFLRPLNTAYVKPDGTVVPMGEQEQKDETADSPAV